MTHTTKSQARIRATKAAGVLAPCLCVCIVVASSPLVFAQSGGSKMASEVSRAPDGSARKPQAQPSREMPAGPEDGEGDESGESVAIGEAEKQLSAGNVAEAIEILQRAVRDDSRNARLQERLGQCYYLKGETARAIDEMQKAVAIEPGHAGYQSNLAWLYTRAGNFGDAIRSANAAISLEPKQAYPYVLLGFAYGSTNRREQAVEALQKALKLDSGNVTAHVYLGDVLLTRGDFEKAADSYNRALQIDDKIAGAYIGLGNSYGKLGQQGKQIECYRKAVEVAPRDADAHGHLGFALSQTGDLVGGMKEGFIANSMRVDTAWDKFMGMFVAVWAGIFIIFGIIFGALFLGSSFKPQPGETLLKSFLLIFHKEKPGRLVVTSRRLIYVPEFFSKSFGATRLSIERSEIAEIGVTRNSSSGTLTIKSTSDTVHAFRMPALVLEPVIKLLDDEGLLAGSGSTGSVTKEPEASDASIVEPAAIVEPQKVEEEQVIAASFDFRPDTGTDTAESVDLSKTEVEATTDAKTD